MTLVPVLCFALHILLFVQNDLVSNLAIWGVLFGTLCNMLSVSSSAAEVNEVSHGCLDSLHSISVSTNDPDISQKVCQLEQTSHHDVQ